MALLHVLDVPLARPACPGFEAPPSLAAFGQRFAPRRYLDILFHPIYHPSCIRLETAGASLKKLSCVRSKDVDVMVCQSKLMNQRGSKYEDVKQKLQHTYSTPSIPLSFLRLD